MRNAKLRITWPLAVRRCFHNPRVQQEHPSALTRPLAELYGVGAERAEHLARLQLHTVGDLLQHRPRHHEDRRRLRPIRDLEVGVAALCRGTILVQGNKRLRGGGRSLFECVIDDGTARLHCRWWNVPYMDRYFRVGDDLLVFAKVSSLKPRTVDHPETERVENDDDNRIHLDRVVPVYPLTEGLSQRWLRRVMWTVVQAHAADVPEPAYALADMPTRAEAFARLHFPDEQADADLARRRLALDEFVELHRTIRKRRLALQARAIGMPCTGKGQLLQRLTGALSFRLTAAQLRVMDEIRKDLAAPHPMRRLLQGDVGCGKTVVAAAATLTVAESGRHTLLMAPTEILAVQHAHRFREWFEPLGVKVLLQTSSQHEASKSQSKTSAPTLVIGTHALLETDFQLPDVGLVIIDEQHKFGVAQRNQLLRKGRCPHLLVMTATPIPRTLGLTLYGDLDISTIDQMPAGRGAVRTHVRATDRLPKVIEFIRGQLENGRQAYVVYPRVGDSATEADVKSVEREAAKLKKHFAPHAVGMLHGKMRPEDKDVVMEAFRAGRLAVLLATTVVEVGVDVPNASVMLVENAECFGLAQLHQLRGRISRGAHAGHFILLTNKTTPQVQERLAVLVETNDGFRVAEADLKLRGPGELLGQNQSGLPSFRFGDLANDFDLIQRARDIAMQFTG